MNDSLSREPVLAEVEKRFRLVPNFFVSTPEAPEVIEKLWDFARAAYLDNPMPTLFKERLFVFLSRFCPVRYCLVRHCGFLVGYGHSSGDPDAKLDHRPSDQAVDDTSVVAPITRFNLSEARRAKGGRLPKTRPLRFHQRSVHYER